MQPKQQTGQPIAAHEKNVREDLIITKTPIESFHGQSLFHCRECRERVPVAFHFKGKMRSPYDSDEVIFVDYLEDELGHTILEMSH